MIKLFQYLVLLASTSPLLAKGVDTYVYKPLVEEKSQPKADESMVEEKLQPEVKEQARPIGQSPQQQCDNEGCMNPYQPDQDGHVWRYIKGIGWRKFSIEGAYIKDSSDFNRARRAWLDYFDN